MIKLVASDLDGTIIDKNNSIMTKYSKNSPSDLGEQRMYKIFRNKRRKLYE